MDAFSHDGHSIRPVSKMRSQFMDREDIASMLSHLEPQSKGRDALLDLEEQKEDQSDLTFHTAINGEAVSNLSHSALGPMARGHHNNNNNNQHR